MLHYKERHNRIHIITLDHVLAEDVFERLTEYPGMESIELIKPRKESLAVTAESILKSARDTLMSRVLIIDVRSQTKPMLQRAYSDIVRFNRPDFNHYCYSVLIGDGPVNLFERSKGINIFQNYLSDLRVEYSPALFFSSPFLHYSYEETQQLAIYRNNELPERIPARLQKYFKESNITVERLCKYFIAAEMPDSMRLRKRKKRLEKLKKLYAQILAKEFPEDKDHLAQALSKEGCALPGESLKLNVYPFFFEEWILDLIKKAESALCA